MQIVVKVAGKTRDGAVDLVSKLVRTALPAAEANRTSVEPVFPDVKVGRRAGMLTLSLDDDTPAGSVEKVLDALRRSDAVEYAQPAAPRTPKHR
jgi:hypothetical protein